MTDQEKTEKSPKTAGPKGFPETLKSLREARVALDPEFTLRQFARKLGISASLLSFIENGKVDPPSPEMIIKMARLFGVDADVLLAKAGKVAPELAEIIIARPRAMANFLRTAKKKRLTESQIDEVTRRLSEK